jgi:hypothetical protein
MVAQPTIEAAELMQGSCRESIEICREVDSIPTYGTGWDSGSN